MIGDALDVAAPAEAVMSFIADTRNAALLMDQADGVRVVPVPGTPVGEVGERQVVIVPWPAGYVTTVREVVARGPERIVTRTSAPSGLLSSFAVEPLGPETCRLFHVRSVAVTAQLADQLRATVPQGVRWALASIAHHVAGAPAVGPPPGASTAEDRSRRAAELRALHTRAGVQRTATEASIEIDAPPPVVWALVSDARHEPAAPDRADTVCFTVPGTPAGAVGELRCRVHGTAERATAELSELVALDIGRMLATRQVAPGIHDRVTTVMLEPVGTRSRVTCRVELVDHDPAPAARERRRAELEAYLGGIRLLAES